MLLLQLLLSIKLFYWWLMLMYKDGKDNVISGILFGISIKMKNVNEFVWLHATYLKIILLVMFCCWNDREAFKASSMGRVRVKTLLSFNLAQALKDNMISFRKRKYSYLRQLQMKNFRINADFMGIITIFKT